MTRRPTASAVALGSCEALVALTRIAVEGFEASLRTADARFRGGLGSLFELEDMRRHRAGRRSQPDDKTMNTLKNLARGRLSLWLAAPAAAPRPALSLTTTQPHTTSLPLKIAANGNIAAWQDAVIGTEANGLRLAEVRVNVGDQHDTAPAAQRPEQAGHRIAAA